MRRLILECLWFLTLSAILIVQISFMNTVGMQRYVFLPLVISLLAIVFRFETRGVIIAAFSGYMMDLYSSLPFGVYTSSMLFACAVLIFLQKNLFKNFAVHAVAINTSIAYSVYALFVLLWCIGVTSIQNRILDDFTVGGYLFSAVLQITVHVGISIVCLLAYSAFSHRIIHSSSDGNRSI